MLLQGDFTRQFGPRPLVDTNEPSAPYYLKAENLFARKDGMEIFIKRIYSKRRDLPDLGPVVLAPGLATNANLFRMDDMGGFLRMDTNRSFANLLASEGFTVYMYHPGYTERVHNRYVSQHCDDSVYRGRRYRASATLDFVELFQTEVPLVLDFVTRHSKHSQVSWIGYSLGGMVAYAHLAQNPDSPIKNLITIGSPVTLNQIFIRLIPYTNMATAALGFEESAFVGGVSQNFVPITRLIRKVPGWILRYDPFTLFLWNPFNLTGTGVKTLLGKIVEPIPPTLQFSLSTMIAEGLACQIYSPRIIKKMDAQKKKDTKFLFFFGQYDMIAPPDTVILAHEIMTPDDDTNLVGVPSAGHVDIVMGRNAMEKVWIPSTKWLKEQCGAAPTTGASLRNSPVKVYTRL